MHVATMPTATPPERTTKPVLLASGMTLGRHRPSYTATAVTHERAIGTTRRHRRWVAAETAATAAPPRAAVETPVSSPVTTPTTTGKRRRHGRRPSETTPSI